MRHLSYIYLIIFLFNVNFLYSQHSEPSEIQAIKLENKIKFDGILNDSIWAEIPHINNFTQRELDFGKPVSERTEVAITYNRNNLYIGIWCYQKDVSKIVAKFLSRFLLRSRR
jgi:hypothetical protein